jgi:hypothetical protein
LPNFDATRPKFDFHTKSKQGGDNENKARLAVLSQRLRSGGALGALNIIRFSADRSATAPTRYESGTAGCTKSRSSGSAKSGAAGSPQSRATN